MLLPGRERNTRFAPTMIVMRGVGGVLLQRRAPGHSTTKKGLSEPVLSGGPAYLHEQGSSFGSRSRRRGVSSAGGSLHFIMPSGNPEKEVKNPPINYWWY